MFMLNEQILEAVTEQVKYDTLYLSSQVAFNKNKWQLHEFYKQDK